MFNFIKNKNDFETFIVLKYGLRYYVRVKFIFAAEKSLTALHVHVCC